VIDEEGFRANVGIILCNRKGKLFLGKRIGQDAWQFPQGGMHENESLEDALYRELKEEVGLCKEHVAIVSVTQEWLRYKLPKPMMRHHSRPLCIGQKQKWFLLRMLATDEHIHLDEAHKPEFDGWAWVPYWYPLKKVIHFKRDVYLQVLRTFKPLVSGKNV